LTKQSAKTVFLREAGTAGTSAHTTFGGTCNAHLSDGILLEATYACADIKVLLTIQHNAVLTERWKKGEGFHHNFFFHQSILAILGFTSPAMPIAFASLTCNMQSTSYASLNTL